MTVLKNPLNDINQRIRQAEKSCDRQGKVKLLAVSKKKPAELIHEAYALGQMDFGESYLQEALGKIRALEDLESIIWHFIGPIQSNKTRDIAGHFQWVHSVDRLKIAERLSRQRPEHLPPLNICLQVNTSEEASKSGVHWKSLSPLVQQVVQLPNLALRGLMTIPAPTSAAEEQHKPFALLSRTLHALNAEHGLEMDTLSMGMSGDLEAAIIEGSTIVRIGTALFGVRA